MKRNKFIKSLAFGAGLVTASGALYRLTRTKSGKYNAKFKLLNEQMKHYKKAVPTLLIDLDILDENIATLKKNVIDITQFRIVVKSLPSPKLIEYLREKIGTDKLMCFHQPFLSQLAEIGGSKVVILMGKPMPVQNVSYFYDTQKSKNGFEAQKQIQWLVDTTLRIEEYIAIAKSKKLKLQLNMEVDVGLRRGGFSNLIELEKGLKLIEANSDFVTFSGFMGYDAHISKIPKLFNPYDKSMALVREIFNGYKELLKTKFPTLYHENLTFNGAGSPTLTLHNNSLSPFNDLSAGSCLVKPVDFDVDTLTMFKPCCFIATPVLKEMNGNTLPSIENLAGVATLLDPNNAKSYYIYGGHWMATPYQPEGILTNPLNDSSTNQTMMRSSDLTDINPGDFAFFRPNQSEFVFLQFGDILTIRNNKLAQQWPVFDYN